MSILIKEVFLNGDTTDVLIEGKQITAVGKNLVVKTDVTIDGSRKAIIPGLVNAHTHAAMTLFRGFADDMPLEAWLNKKIWPNEAKLTNEDVYWGAKLACLEMIKTGTTTFFDMYHKWEATAQAVAEMGIRGVLSGVCFDHFNEELTAKSQKECLRLLEVSKQYGSRVNYALGPHAIYTVSGKMLQWCDIIAREKNLPIHLHLAETQTEVANAVARFGTTPVRYLYNLGVLSPHLILAHCLWLDSDEIRMLADYGVKVVHNPASNMKLASGYRFKYEEMKAAGVLVGLGTDGCSSSNNLDMIEAMKLASLLNKAWSEDPEALPAMDAFRMATVNGNSIFQVNGGVIAAKQIADVCLIDLNTPAFTPNFNFVSNLVYAANGSHVDTVICDGKILMQNRKVEGEDEILEKAGNIAFNLMSR